MARALPSNSVQTMIPILQLLITIGTAFADTGEYAFFARLLQLSTSKNPAPGVPTVCWLEFDEVSRSLIRSGTGGTKQRHISENEIQRVKRWMLESEGGPFVPVSRQTLHFTAEKLARSDDRDGQRIVLVGKMEKLGEALNKAPSAQKLTSWIAGHCQ